MARDNEMHERLIQWGQLVTVGDGSGYPTMSVLHKEWQPPSPGVTPSMKSRPPNQAMETHRLLCHVSPRPRAAVVVQYAKNLPAAQQAVELGCSVRTIANLIERAHCELRQQIERERKAVVYENCSN